MAEVQRLAATFHEYGSLAALSPPHLLFDVVDARQEAVAIYLLQEGCDGTVTKQVCNRSNTDWMSQRGSCDKRD